MDPKTTQAICAEWIERVFGIEFVGRGNAADPEVPPNPENQIYSVVYSEWRRIVDVLFSTTPVDETLRLPEEFIRLRSVQEISAAEAVSHIFVLKDIVRERFGSAHDCGDLSKRMDYLALHTFNSYMQCRERLFALRLSEIKEYGASETFSCPSSQFNK